MFAVSLFFCFLLAVFVVVVENIRLPLRHISPLGRAVLLLPRSIVRGSCTAVHRAGGVINIGEGPSPIEGASSSPSTPGSLPVAHGPVWPPRSARPT